MLRPIRVPPHGRANRLRSSIIEDELDLYQRQEQLEVTSSDENGLIRRVFGSRRGNDRERDRPLGSWRYW